MKDNKEIRKRLFLVILVYSLTGLTALALILLSKYTKYSFKCPMHELFGIYCSGCGATRMTLALLHLDIYQAFRYNMYILITLPFITGILIRHAYVYIKYDKMMKNFEKLILIYTLGLIIFGILRNFDSFNFLIPTKI